MNELALFAGAGGGILGGELLGWRTVCSVEINAYCCRRLLQRQNEGHLPPFPIWDDVRNFRGQEWRGKIDVVSGGFPCQAFSTATHGKSNAKDFWPEMFSIVQQINPPLVFGENVSIKAITKAAKDCSGKSGYRTKTLALSAADLGADHIRNRYWFLAYTDMCRELLRPYDVQTSELSEFDPSIWRKAPENWSDRSKQDKLQGLGNSLAVREKSTPPSEPRSARVVDGVAGRMDRYKAIGNGQVPAVAAAAFCILAYEALRDLEQL